MNTIFAVIGFSRLCQKCHLPEHAVPDLMDQVRILRSFRLILVPEKHQVQRWINGQRHVASGHHTHYEKIHLKKEFLLNHLPY